MVITGSPTFNISKLIWLNGCYIRDFYSEVHLSNVISDKFFSPRYIKNIIPLIRDRIEKYTDFFKYTSYFFDPRINVKHMTKYLIVPYGLLVSIYIYKTIKMSLVKSHYFSASHLQTLIEKICLIFKVKKRNILIPIRLLLTKRKDSPPLFITIATIGRHKSVMKLQRLIAFLEMQV